MAFLKLNNLPQFCLQIQTDYPLSNSQDGTKTLEPQLTSPPSPSLSPPTHTIKALATSNSSLFPKCALSSHPHIYTSFFLDPPLLYLVNAYLPFRARFKDHLFFRTSLAPPTEKSLLVWILVFFFLPLPLL